MTAMIELKALISTTKLERKNPKNVFTLYPFLLKRSRRSYIFCKASQVGQGNDTHIWKNTGRNLCEAANQEASK